MRLTFYPFKGEQDVTDVFRIVGGALNCSVESFPAVNRVPIRSMVFRESFLSLLQSVFLSGFGGLPNKPFKIVVFQPHVGIFGVPLSHDVIPQLSGFLHVLAVEGLVRNRKRI